MLVNRFSWGCKEFPESLKQIPGPPKVIYHRGQPLSDLLNRPRLAIIGSRNVSAYGRYVTSKLASEIAEQGVVVISGLALGVDAIAHRSTLEVNGLAIAVLPGPVDRPYPASNALLAGAILEGGGALISEYLADEFNFKSNFVARNRLVSGLAQAILITEAAEKSGSLHTARFALEQGKDVLAVPGSINSPGSVGTNNLIKAGATPVTDIRDILHALKLKPHHTKPKLAVGRNANEQTIIDLILQGHNDGELLIKLSKLSVSDFNQALTMLELGGKLRSLGANQWSLA